MPGHVLSERRMASYREHAKRLSGPSPRKPFNRRATGSTMGTTSASHLNLYPRVPELLHLLGSAPSSATGSMGVQSRLRRGRAGAEFGRVRQHMDNTPAPGHGLMLTAEPSFDVIGFAGTVLGAQGHAVEGHPLQRRLRQGPDEALAQALDVLSQ